MKKWNVGLIGCGGNLRGAHVPEYREDERLNVKAVCDIIRERAEYVRDTWFPDAEVYTDYKELLKDEEIDSVDVCTPNYLHSIIAVDAFAAGKHVFTEKPDAINVEEVLKMKNAAEKAGKTLMVMRNNRFNDASILAKNMIEEGRLGDVYCGRCGWIRRRGIPGKGGWFTTKAQSGGGPLIDLGVHIIDLAIWLMGNPKPVAVTGTTYRKFADNDSSDSEHSKFGDKVEDGTFDVEDLAMGTIRFDNGAQLQIEFSWASNIQMEERFLELRGSKAGLKWTCNENVESLLEIFSEEQGHNVNSSIRCGSVNSHPKYLKHYYDVLLEGAEPIFKPQEGVDMIKILCGIYESAETGHEVIL